MGKPMGRTYKALGTFEKHFLPQGSSLILKKRKKQPKPNIIFHFSTLILCIFLPKYLFSKTLNKTIFCLCPLLELKKYQNFTEGDGEGVITAHGNTDMPN